MIGVIVVWGFNVLGYYCFFSRGDDFDREIVEYMEFICIYNVNDNICMIIDFYLYRDVIFVWVLIFKLIESV